ncbi:MAG: sugar phosphate isomerase/epimerase [Bacteroidaceae bacterium]|nr:sugar phosphate isomerase/epimerase [Bacteroidaceae bacterium]MBR1543194.1 sugar phosphate isomerase/epimerase [Bacteroidaceae bacterium]
MNRRNFLGMGAAALAGLALVPSMSSCDGQAKPAAKAADGKPNSNFGGVHMGTITYSWRDMPGGLENLIKYCKEANVSNLELMGNDLETCLGAPESPMMGLIMGAMARLTPEERDGAMRRLDGIMGILNDDEKKQMNDYNEGYANFKKNLDWNKVEEVRKRFESEGIDIHIVKTQPGADSSDEDCEYAFKLAKAMGAKGVTSEMSLAAAKRCAPFAEKYDMFYCMHNHFQYATPEFAAGPDEVLAVSPNVMLNFDFAHYFGSTGKNPCDFIEKYHDRIFSMHTKDKTGPNAQTPNENQVWGQGQTPLEDVLKLVQSKYPQIYCDAELEYQVAPWSNSVKEVGTCMKFARRVLELG